MSLHKFVNLLFLVFSLHVVSCAQGQKNSAEKLGYPKETKLLIIHADDLGVAHSVNQASTDAFEAGGISSASIMVPCPWFPEIASYAQHHPEICFGLHLTLTSEWEHYRWDGVLPASEIPSLIGADGYFYPSSELVAQKADPAEVEKEIRAQVARAISFGINPTHLDSHMGSLFQRPEFFKSYVEVGRDYGIPVFIPYESVKSVAPALLDIPGKDYFFVDQYYMADTQTADQWAAYYSDILKNLKPGLTEIIVHLAYDNAEMQAVAVNHPDFGSAWRQRDFDFFTSEEAKRLLKENNIILITWKEIQEKMKAAATK